MMALLMYAFAARAASVSGSPLASWAAKALERVQPVPRECFLGGDDSPSGIRSLFSTTMALSSMSLCPEVDNTACSGFTHYPSHVATTRKGAVGDKVKGEVKGFEL